MKQWKYIQADKPFERFFMSSIYKAVRPLLDFQDVDLEAGCLADVYEVHYQDKRFAAYLDNYDGKVYCLEIPENISDDDLYKILFEASEIDYDLGFSLLYNLTYYNNLLERMKKARTSNRVNIWVEGDGLLMNREYMLCDPLCVENNITFTSYDEAIEFLEKELNATIMGEQALEWENEKMGIPNGDAYSSDFNGKTTTYYVVA